MMLRKDTKSYKLCMLQTNLTSIFGSFIILNLIFLICLSDRSQCLESHGMVDFAYKLQLHYTIYTLIFPIWTESIIKVKIPLGYCKLYAKRNIPWESAEWDLQKRDEQNILWKKGPP